MDMFRARELIIEHKKLFDLYEGQGEKRHNRNVDTYLDYYEKFGAGGQTFNMSVEQGVLILASFGRTKAKANEYVNKHWLERLTRKFINTTHDRLYVNRTVLLLAMLDSGFKYTISNKAYHGMFWNLSKKDMKRYE